MVTITIKDDNVPFAKREFENFEDFLAQFDFESYLKLQLKKSQEENDWVEL